LLFKKLRQSVFVALLISPPSQLHGCGHNVLGHVALDVLAFAFAQRPVQRQQGQAEARK
jgi:hypothetical protein